MLKIVSEAQYHLAIALRDDRNLYVLAEKYSTELLNYLLTDNLLSASEKITYFQKLQTYFPDSTFTTENLTMLGQVFIAALRSNAPQSEERITEMLCFFIRHAKKVSQKTVADEEKQPPTTAHGEKRPTSSLLARASICTQLVEAITANPAYWSCLYRAEPIRLLQLAIELDAKLFAEALLRCAPYTQTHAIHMAGLYWILGQLMPTYEKRADLVDLKLYLDKVFINPESTKRSDRKRIRAEAYLEVLGVLERYIHSNNGLQAKAEIVMILQQKMAAEEKVAAGFLSKLVDNSCTFTGILEGLLANLDNVLLQYRQHQTIFQAHLATLQPEFAKLQLATAKSQKSEAEVTKELIAYFLQDQALQIPEAHKPLKEFFYSQLTLWTGDQLRAVFKQLHPTIAAEIYRNNQFRTKLPESTWLGFALWDQYATLAKRCFYQFKEEVWEEDATAQQQISASTTNLEVNFYLKITPTVLLQLAQATKNSENVEFCLEKFNNPADRFYSQEAVIGCYQYLIGQNDVFLKDLITYHYQLAIYYLGLGSNSQAMSLCDKALLLEQRSPELLAAAILKRLSAIPRLKTFLVDDIQTELSNDPGYQAFIRNVSKEPRATVYRHLYHLYKNLSLHTDAWSICKDTLGTYPLDTSVEIALLFERAHPLKPITPVTVWEGPRQAKAQIPTTGDAKAEITKDLCLPSLIANEVLASKEFQTRTLQMLHYLTRKQWLRSESEEHKQQSVIIAKDRVEALLHPYITDFTRPVPHAIAVGICKELASIDGIQRVLAPEFYRSFLLPMSYTEIWPAQGSGLTRLLQAELLSKEDIDELNFTREELALLNGEAMAQKFIQLKLKPKDALNNARSCLGTQADNWTQIQKLYLGLWLPTYGRGYPLQNRLWSPGGYYNIPSSWTFTPLCCQMMQKTLSDCIRDQETGLEIFLKFNIILDIFNECSHDEWPLAMAAATFCKEIIPGYSGKLLEDARKQVRKISTSGASPAILYAIAIGLGDDNLLQEVVKKDADQVLELLLADYDSTSAEKLAAFARKTLPIFVKIEPYIGRESIKNISPQLLKLRRLYLALVQDANPLAADSESKLDDAREHTNQAGPINLLSFFIFSEPRLDEAIRAEEKGRATSVSNSQLVQAILANPAYWDYFYTPETPAYHGFKPLHVAAQAMPTPDAIEVITFLLSQAPYTQLHVKDKAGKEALSYVSDVEKKLLKFSPTQAKLADLVDFKFYIDQVFFEKKVFDNKGPMLEDRKLVRGEAYLEILALLEKYADKMDSWTLKTEMIKLIDEKLAAEKAVSSKWYRLNSTSTFVEILQGLKLNLDKLLPQYCQFRGTFKGHGEELAPIVGALQTKSPAVQKREAAKQAGFTLVQREAPVTGLANQDDDVDDDLRPNLTHSNRTLS